MCELKVTFSLTPKELLGVSFLGITEKIVLKYYLVKVQNVLKFSKNRYNQIPRLGI